MSRSIQDCLMKLTPDELYDLGFRMLIMPPEDRKDRSAWMKPLTDALNGPALDLLLCLTGEEWDAVRICLHAGNGENIRFAQAKHDLILNDAVQQLRSMGLCWRDQHCWHVQPLVHTLLDADDLCWRILQTADDVYAAIQGYLRIYGILPARELLRLVTPVLKGRAVPDDTVSEDFILGIWRRRNGLSDIMMAGDGLWLLCPDAEDVDNLYADLHKPQLQMKPYAPYSLEEAIACGRGAPPGRCDAYDELLAFYQSHGVDRETALTTLDESVLLFQLGHLESVMEALVLPLSFAPTPTQLRILKLVFMRAPSWKLKGSCAEEMLPPSARINRRIRQDDPCPCGSGRRYKYCCGRRQ